MVKRIIFIFLLLTSINLVYSEDEPVVGCEAILGTGAFCTNETIIGNIVKICNSIGKDFDSATNAFLPIEGSDDGVDAVCNAQTRDSVCGRCIDRVIPTEERIKTEPFLPLIRYYDTRSFDHASTTGYISNNYTYEAILGYVSFDIKIDDDFPDRELYMCQPTKGNYMLTTSSDCEGLGGPLTFLGFSWSKPGPDRIPIYRCFIGQDHFESNDPNCEGQKVHGIVTYLKAPEFVEAPVIPLFLSINSKEVSTLNQLSFDEGEENIFYTGFIFNEQVFNSVPLYSCFLGNDPFLSHDSNCEVVQENGTLLGYLPLDEISKIFIDDELEFDIFIESIGRCNGPQGHSISLGTDSSFIGKEECEEPVSINENIGGESSTGEDYEGAIVEAYLGNIMEHGFFLEHEIKKRKTLVDWNSIIATEIDDRRYNYLIFCSFENSNGEDNVCVAPQGTCVGDEFCEIQVTNSIYSPDEPVHAEGNCGEGGLDFNLEDEVVFVNFDCSGERSENSRSDLNLVNQNEEENNIDLVFIIEDYSDEEALSIVENALFTGEKAFFATRPLQGEDTRFNIYYKTIPALDYSAITSNECEEFLNANLENFFSTANNYQKIESFVFITKHPSLIPNAGSGPAIISTECSQGLFSIDSPEFSGVVTHELGHSLFNLEDEYLTGGPPIEGLNCANNFESALDKWSIIPSFDEDELYSSCGVEGFLRHGENTIMNSQMNINDGWFNSWGPVNEYYIRRTLERYGQ